MNDDPHLWLEEIESEEALSWVNERNDEALAQFESDPRFEGFRVRNEEILTSDDRIPVGAFDGRYVYNFWTDITNIRGVLRRTSLESYQSEEADWETVLDVDALAREEVENWVYQGMEVLQPDNDLALIKLSRGGADAAVIREFDLAEKALVADGFMLPEAKSDVSWIDRDHLLVGSDFGEGSLTDAGYARCLKIWKRGEILQESPFIFEGEQTDMGMYPLISNRADRTTVFARRMIDFFRSEFFWVGPGNKTKKLPISIDSNIISMFDELVLFSIKKPWTTDDGQHFRAAAVLVLDLDEFLDSGAVKIASVYEPAEQVSIESVTATRDGLFIAILEQVCSRLVVLHRSEKGWRERPVALPTGGLISIVSASGHHNLVFALYQSFLVPSALYVINDDEVSKTPIRRARGHFDASRFQMRQCFAKSADGTNVPYFLITAKNAQHNGQTPTLLFGYGGFQIPLTPSYIGPHIIQWLESGGAYAVANIRGGGELGPKWHQAALKENRQRSYDDFIAVAEDLIETGITSPRHLGIQGGSNGGLLMGVMLTQRPELFGAIVCQVPLLDMLRYHFLLAGASWVSEYGSPDIAGERGYILQYSPYQNLSPDGQYPNIFITTSTRDDRVHPGHARKMTARLIEQGHSVHYYENIEGGHGGVANAQQSAHINAMMLVYLLRQLSDKPHSQKQKDGS